MNAAALAYIPTLYAVFGLLFVTVPLTTITVAIPLLLSWEVASREPTTFADGGDIVGLNVGLCVGVENGVGDDEGVGFGVMLGVEVGVGDRLGGSIAVDCGEGEVCDDFRFSNSICR